MEGLGAGHAWPVRAGGGRFSTEVGGGGPTCVRVTARRAQELPWGLHVLEREGGTGGEGGRVCCRHAVWAPLGAPWRGVARARGGACAESVDGRGVAVR